jgi:hypothetical protein
MQLAPGQTTKYQPVAVGRRCWTNAVSDVCGEVTEHEMRLNPALNEPADVAVGE